MRTAVTLAKTHKGAWELLKSPGDPMHVQYEEFRKLLALQSHPKYCLITYQESDGEQRQIRLRTPDEQKRHDDARAAELSAIRKESAPKPESAKAAA